MSRQRDMEGSPAGHAGFDIDGTAMSRHDFAHDEQTKA
jgi:hypothetical protein